VDTPRPRQRAGKLSFKEQRELDALPGTLEALEQEQIAIGERMAAPDYHKQGADVMRADRARAAAIEILLAASLERWVELEGRLSSKE
jgi:ATP-binding cassette subfamily F protein uup